MITEVATTTEHYMKLVEILGSKYVTDKVQSPYDFIQLASKGINANVIKNFRTYFNLPNETTANMLNVSSPTIYRWIKGNRNLDKNSMVKLFEIADLFLYGSEVFGNNENFFKWLNLPNTALGGMEPSALVEVPGGVSKVRDIIGRIEHGVYS